MTYHTPKRITRLGYGKSDIEVIFNDVFEMVYTGEEFFISYYKAKLGEQISDIWLYYFDAYRIIGAPYDTSKHTRYVTELTRLTGIDKTIVAATLSATYLADRAKKITFDLKPTKNKAVGTGFVTTNSLKYIVSDLVETTQETVTKTPEIAAGLFNWGKFVIPAALVAYFVFTFKPKGNKNG